MPRGKFKHRFWYFADTPNNGRSNSVIWKDLWWRPDFYRHLKLRGGCTIPMFQLSVWCEKCVAARHYSVIGKKLLFANNRNRVRWVVLCLSQDGACTDLFENCSENSSLKGDLSNNTTLNPPLFSLKNFPPCFSQSPFQHCLEIFISSNSLFLQFSYCSL